MVLFYNVYLADKPLEKGGRYYRGRYSSWVNTMDVFKYTLASVANLYPWSRVIINYETCDTLKHRVTELNNYINNLFGKYDLLLSNKRLERQSDWKVAYKYLNNDLIYFCCNHDHVFIDSASSHFLNCVEEFRKESAPIKSLYFSHWHEVNVMFHKDSSANRKTRALDSDCDLNNIYTYYRKKNSTIRDTYAFVTHSNFDSIQIINKQLYHDWWFPGDFEHMFLPRSDYFGDVIPNQPKKLQSIPYREFFRHFDGYTHVHHTNREWQTNVLRSINALTIPPGFFNNNLKIRFGYDENKEDWININLNKDNYTSLDSNGTDYKLLSHQLPYFWKDIITDIDVNKQYNENLFHSKWVEQLFAGFNHFDGLNHFGGSEHIDFFSNKTIVDKIKTSYNIK